jgi:hypothetical protein
VRLTARKLELIARQAYNAKQIEELEYASQLMLGIPLPEQQIVSTHYQALSCRLKGEYEKSLELSWRVVESPLAAYRTRAFLNIGNVCYALGRIEQSLPFFVASSRTAGNDCLSWAQSSWMIANARVRQGDYKDALTGFQCIEPIVHYLTRHNPILHCDFLNDVAFALGEAGRSAEGLRLCAIGLSSPYASFCPQLSETRSELEAKREATPVLVHIDLPQENTSSPAQSDECVDYSKDSKIVERLNTVIFPFYSNDYLSPSRLAAPATCARGRLASPKSRRVDKTSVIPRGPPSVLNRRTTDCS